MITIAQVGFFEIVAVLVYLAVTAYLGWLGYKGTKNATDYLLAGRKAHPVIMALSYGATFISTSAIVGFGGVAALFGMSLLWLTFCNIFIGIFIAFVFLGGRTRRIGHILDAHTFPELLGRRYQSRFVQVLSAIIISLFMPLYCAAVLIGGTEFISVAFGINYEVALFVFAVIVGAYVIFGGLKGVMYTDALQGGIMFVGMSILIIFVYSKFGGITQAHKELSDLAPLVPPSLQAIGHRGWTAMPQFGFGDIKYNLWWIVVSTIVMGVGIGVLAQPQLIVRFMTVKSSRELNRAVGIGGFFILAMTGVAFVIGALSNAYFAYHGQTYSGRVIRTIDEQKGFAYLQLMKPDSNGRWLDIVDVKMADGKTTISNILQSPQIDGSGRWLPVAKSTNSNGQILEGKVIPAVIVKDEQPVTVAGSPPVVKGRSISIVAAKGIDGQIIPTFITSAMPKWFSVIFMLTLLAAAMSTLSSQFHTIGTAVGRDIIENVGLGSTPDKTEKTVLTVKVAILVGLVIAVLIGFYGRSETIIARATAIFFGLCASSFLPAFVLGLFWKRMTRAAAVCSMIVGFVVTAFWLLFVKVPEISAFKLVSKSILADYPNWSVVDPLVIALPVSAITAVIVSLITDPPDQEHIAKCFQIKNSTTNQK